MDEATIKVGPDLVNFGARSLVTCQRAGVEYSSVKLSAPRAVGDLLPSAVLELRDRLREERIRQAWRAVVGADAVRRTWPARLADGCLTVNVDNSPWLSELTLRGSEVVARLRERFGDVHSVRFVLGPLGEGNRSLQSRESRPVRALSGDDVQKIEQAVAPITDADIRAAARRLLTRAWKSPSR
jgi:hypothetical protein